MANRETKCGTCGEEIAPILDPWGYDNWRGTKYGWHHVKATNNSDGKYVVGCAEEYDGEEATPTYADRLAYYEDHMDADERGQAADDEESEAE